MYNVSNKEDKQIFLNLNSALSAGAVEYADCTSAEG